jgi:hypothetical protein
MHKLSLYSFRYLWAGETWLLLRQLTNLPGDLWQWYMDRAGRSQAANSYMNYVSAYTALFGSRLRYITDLGREHLAPVFRSLMFGW